MEEIQITLEGPYSFVRNSPFPSVFDSPIAVSAGFYIWTGPLRGQEAELVHYVGETGRSFLFRMAEHVKGYLSGEYGINDPAILQKGKRFRIWEGLWRGAKIQEFLDRYEELSGKIMELLHLYRLYLLPLDCDAKMRKRIEGNIVQALIDQGGLVGEFQEPDYGYQKPKIDSDRFRVKLHFNAPILGLSGGLIV